MVGNSDLLMRRSLLCLVPVLIVIIYVLSGRRELSVMSQRDVIPDTVNNYNTVSDNKFRDEYFEPILDTFRNTSAYARLTIFRNGSVPNVLIITPDGISSPFWSESLRLITNRECPLPCTVTDNITERETADAVLVYLMHVKSVEDLNLILPQRDTSQPWIIHSVEQPTTANKKGLRSSVFNGVFNRTMFYRRDADIAWTHGFIVSKRDAEYLPPHWRHQGPPIEQLPFAERKPAVAFITNCNSVGGRQDYIVELGNHIQVDVFGNCGKLKCGSTRYVEHRHHVEDDDCLKDAAKNYLFYLSFENSVCKDYITEKAYNIQYYPVVPILFGGADFTKLFPPNSYIDALQFTPKELATHMRALAANETEYRAMLAWKEHYVVSTVAERCIYCQLCTRLYDPAFYEENVYDDFHDWFISQSKCRRYYN